MRQRTLPSRSSRSSGRPLLLSALLALFIAGCLHEEGGSRGEPEAGPAEIEAPDADHDHRDASLHDAASGLELVGLAAAEDLLGGEDARLSDVQFHGSVAAVAVNGRAGASSGGFVLLDVADPSHPRLLSRYRSGSEDNWYVKFSPDGRQVLLTANGGSGNPNATAGGLLASLSEGVATSGARGIQVVDVSDVRAPRLVAFHPVPVRVVNLAVEERDGTVWVYASVVEDRLPVEPGERPAVGTNHVRVLRLLADPPRLEEAARWSPPAPSSACPGAVHLPHDLALDTHPVTGERLLYVGHWDSGYVLLDVTDPRAPRERSILPIAACGEHGHTYKPHPGLVDGRALAVAAPETFGGDLSGRYLLVDVTDPDAPSVVSEWSLPGDLTNDEPLLWSPHEFSLADGRLFTSNYHGGAWVLDLATFTPIAAWQRSLGDPARTGDWAVDVETAVWRDGLLWVVDMNAGVAALRLTK